MAYIGKSPTGTGVRQRYYFTATGGETSLSGADDNSNTLVFSDGNYVDVSLNGIALVAGTDYNTSTANTIGGLSALSASDIVEIVVYDIFTVADTVSAKDGGTFSGNVAMGGTLSVTGASTLTGAATATGGLNVGTIKEATGTTTAMTIDSNGRVDMDASYVFDQFELSSSIGAAGDITSNLRRVQHSAFASVNGVTESSGIFSFPFTGLYRVEVFYKSSPLSNDNIVLSIYATINNSSYFQTSAANARGAGDQSSYCSALINVTDISLVKVKFNLASVTSGSVVAGSTSNTQTSFIFTRVAPAQ